MSAGVTVAGRTPEQIAEVLYGGTRSPTGEQSRVTSAGLDPVLVVAGAGSGKTETMAMRVLWLLDNHADLLPDQVLCLTFTRKAAGEIADRVRERLRDLRTAGDRFAGQVGTSAVGAEDALGLGIGEPTMATYHSYAAALVREHGLRLGIDPESVILSQAGQWQLASEVVESWSGDLDTSAAVGTIITAVLELAAGCNEHLVEPADVRDFLQGLLADIDSLPTDDRSTGPGRPTGDLAKVVTRLRERERLIDLVEEYIRRKRVRGVLDFGDQVALAARLARFEPVRAAERDRFRVVLLDEYQDTSVAQLTLLSALFGDGHSVTAVGDPNQAIYGWRGASSGGLERFPEMFRRADGAPAEQLTLSIAWRNPPEVLQVANRIAAPLRAAARVTVPELRPRPGAAAAPPGAQVVRAVFTTTLEEETRAVAEFLREHWWEPNQRSGAPLRTAAVLCRARSQFPAVVEQLRAAGFEPEVVGLGGLLDTPELVDLIAALEVTHDPSRGDSLMRLLTGHRMRLGAADLLALADWAAVLAGRTSVRPLDPDAPVDPDVVDERSIVDALDDLPPPGWTSPQGRSLSAEGRARLVELAQVLETLRAQTALPLPELVLTAERLLNLDIELMARPGVPAWRARQHLDAFIDVAHDFLGATDRPTLGGFLAWLDAARTEEHGLGIPTPDPVPGGLQVLTVHAAKGLEWDVVAVPGMVDGVFPGTPNGRVPKDPDAPLKDSGWLTGYGTLPYPLRGDRDHLPHWRYDEAGTLKDLAQAAEQFKVESGAHELAEERRLAYVAVTRTKERLLLSGSWWRASTLRARPSVFLRELVAAGLVSDVEWAPPPPDDASNPALDAPRTGHWPPERPDVAGSTPLRRAADAVREALSERRAGIEQTGRRADARDGVDWVQEAKDLLEEQRAAGGSAEVELPEHLSASAVVELAADPARFARALRRPVPRRPSVRARRGTAFHAWVEQYFGAASLVDVDELPGADDDSTGDTDLAVLQRNFLASPWAARTPVAVEVDVETPVADTVLRCRIDAVFADGPDPARASDITQQRFVVVDWKTGRPPTDPQDAAERQVQLAAYRLAWSRYAGVPLVNVRAAFYFAATGETVFAERLLDEAAIEALLAAEPAQEVPG